MDCSTPGFPEFVLHQLLGLLKLTSIELVMPSNHLITFHPLSLLLLLLPRSKVFSKESILCLGWSKSEASASPSVVNILWKEYSGLISCRMEGWISCCSRNSQEFCPILQFKSINSLALSFLYVPALTSIHNS